MVENVGNLVCPANFDLGEAHKVVIFSVTEGEDKPLKYPDMFHAADLMILSKCDLLPYLTFDVDLALKYARQINSELQTLQISATKGEGMQQWLDWITAGAAMSSRKKMVLMQWTTEFESYQYHNVNPAMFRSTGSGLWRLAEKYPLRYT